MTRTLTCRDVIDLLAEYLEQGLSEDVIAELERHLARCPACVAYLNTYRRTRELTGEVTRVAMPEDMKARLREFLLAQIRRS